MILISKSWKNFPEMVVFLIPYFVFYIYIGKKT